MNIELAQTLLQKLASLGVAEYCLCAGARNGPLVAVLEKSQGASVYHFFEERSAGFFALGRIKRLHKPVAVITTSGTAVAELLPAVMEAYYSGLPLVVISADRPREYRGSGAPQCAEQVGIFGTYVDNCVDIANKSDINNIYFNKNLPQHCNICFAEPLLDAPLQPIVIQPIASEAKFVLQTPQLEPTELACIRRPLVVFGALDQGERDLINYYLFNKYFLFYAESNSGFRNTRQHGLVRSEKTLRQLVNKGLVDGVIRIGGVPTLRFWRDLELSFAHLPVINLSQNPWRGLSRKAQVFAINDQNLKNINESLFTSELCQETHLALAADQRLHEQIQDLLKQFPQSEPAWFWQLSQKISSASDIFIGNSLPIREWDLFSTSRGSATQASRGLNGIDGQLSTFLGWSADSIESWGIFGDLTTMYDMAAPWILSQLPTKLRRLVVVNNGGGQIFSRLFKSPWFLNSHNLSFAPLAQFWGWQYQMWREASDMNHMGEKPTMIEIRPCAQQTRQFWQKYDELEA